MAPEANNTEVLVALARVEGKIDLTLAENAALKTTTADHESRLRTIEGAPEPDPKTEGRLAALESRSTVSAGQLWAGLLGVTALVGTVSQIARLWFGG